MYDEFDNKENEDRYDPKQPSAEDEVKTGQMYGEEDQLSETEEVQASTAEETEASAESGGAVICLPLQLRKRRTGRADRQHTELTAVWFIRASCRRAY